MNLPRFRGFVLAVVIAMGGSFVSFGQTQMFLKVGDIKGGTLDSQHPGESEIFSWSWGSARPIITGVGSRSAGTPVVSTVTIAKQMDVASVPLMKACALATRMKNAVITLRTGNDQAVEFCRVVLEDVTVLSISESAGGDGVPIESLELNYARVGIQYISIVSGAPGPVSTFGWDGRNATLANLNFPPVLGSYEKDSDGDGMPDSWEGLYGLDPSVDDSGADADGDGATNGEEFLAGTNPRDATEVFRARLSFAAGDRMATLTWPSVTGRQYNLLTTDTLGSAFQNLMTVPSGGATTSIPVPLDLAKRFFRVQVVPTSP